MVLEKESLFWIFFLIGFVLFLIHQNFCVRKYDGAGAVVYNKACLEEGQF